MMGSKSFSHDDGDGGLGISGKIAPREAWRDIFDTTEILRESRENEGGGGR